MRNIAHHLYCLLAALALTTVVNAQELVFTRHIQVTDTVEEEGVRFAVSSDDAEQENDEIDALFDDDLDAGWEGAPEDQNILTTGLRFRNIYLPKGAVIDSAFIVLYSHEGKSAEDVAIITIAGEAADHSQTFTESDLITSRPQTSAKVTWVVDDEWILWGEYRTPDIRAIVQEIVNRPGWSYGSPITLLLKGENQGFSDFENAREFESFENIADPEDGGDGQNHPERVPQLVIYFSVEQGRMEIPIMVTDTVEEDSVRLAVSSDDAEQENDEIDALFDDDLDAGWEGAPEDQNILTTGMRFRNVWIPRGVRIDSAYIEVWSHEGKSAEDVAVISVAGEASGHAETFTEDALITDRAQTVTQVTWTVDEEWTLWGKYRTPDLRAIVEEITARPDWSAGNAMAFLLKGANQGPSDFENAREFESFENIADPEDGGDGQNHPERVPRLVVYYSSMTTSVDRPSFAADHGVRLYPNPASGQVSIAFEADGGTSRISIFDRMGRLVRQVETVSNPANVSTQGLPAGYYVIHIQRNGTSVTRPVIIQD
jgi:hypothetical protein